MIGRYKTKYICVYGAVNDKIEDKYKMAGYELGKMIAKNWNSWARVASTRAWLRSR